MQCITSLCCSTTTSLLQPATMSRAALLLLAACSVAAAAAAAVGGTTIEPDRPVWPEEFEVGHGPCGMAGGIQLSCQLPAMPRARRLQRSAAPCARHSPPARTTPISPPVGPARAPQVSWDFEVPYIAEYQKGGLTYKYQAWQDAKLGRQKVVRDGVETVLTLVPGERRSRCRGSQP